MANYYSTCRTNYFHVNDMEKFEAWLNDLAWEGFELCKEKDGTVCILCDNGWPQYKGEDYDEEIDFVQEIKKFLPEKEVVVFVEAGAEKHRYVVGRAVAVMKGRKPVVIDIWDIYNVAKKRFGVEKISEAAY